MVAFKGLTLIVYTLYSLSNCLHAFVYTSFPVYTNFCIDGIMNLTWEFDPENDTIVGTNYDYREDSGNIYTAVLLSGAAQGIYVGRASEEANVTTDDFRILKIQDMVASDEGDYRITVAAPPVLNRDFVKVALHNTTVLNVTQTLFDNSSMTENDTVTKDTGAYIYPIAATFTPPGMQADMTITVDGTPTISVDCDTLGECPATDVTFPADGIYNVAVIVDFAGCNTSLQTSFVVQIDPETTTIPLTTDELDVGCIAACAVLCGIVFIIAIVLLVVIICIHSKCCKHRHCLHKHCKQTGEPGCKHLCCMGILVVVLLILAILLALSAYFACAESAADATIISLAVLVGIFGCVCIILGIILVCCCCHCVTEDEDKDPNQPACGMNETLSGTIRQEGKPEKQPPPRGNEYGPRATTTVLFKHKSLEGIPVVPVTGRPRELPPLFSPNEVSPEENDDDEELTKNKKKKKKKKKKKTDQN